MSERLPNIVRAAYVELISTDLERARWFWVDMLGFVVTAADADALYLRGYEEANHHCLVLRNGAAASAACISFRVWSPEDLDDNGARAPTDALAAVIAPPPLWRWSSPSGCR